MKKSGSNSTKKILIIILALVIGSFIGYRFALAQSGNTLKSVVEPGSMTSEASYIIFTDGTDYYARNGTTGEIDFSGTNASQVIQSTINTLPNGGIIHFKNGIYPNVNLAINCSAIHSLIIEGEGYNTQILGVAGGTTPCLRFYTDGGSDNTFPYRVVIRNILVAANSNSGNESVAVEIQANAICSLENVWLIDSYAGLKLISLTEFNAYNVYTVFNIIGVLTEASPQAPTTMNFYQLTSRMNNVGVQLDNAFGASFYGGVIESNSGGLLITGCSGKHVFYGTWFEANTNYDINDSTAYATYNHENYGYDLLLTNPIIFGPNSWWHFDGGEINSSLLTLTSGAKVGFNKVTGFVTENSGNATVSNNAWIAHGIATTPSIVTVTSMNATYSNQPVIVSWTNSNSTHFQVGVYWSNGTAITNNVIGISWRAEV